ncbi:MAG: EAL domain-containing protein [Sphingomonadales bacterium]
MHDKTAQRIVELKKILEQGSFSLAFQPIVDLRTREVHHYEALARFEGGRSTLGTVVFAEETGLAEEFDRAICKAVIDMLKQNEPSRKAVDIAINLSGWSLQSASFVRMLDELLKSVPKRLGTILLEVTETAEIKDLSAVNKVLQQFRSSGHPVCIDDFGTGSSVFHYLRAFDVDYVKIDRSFTRAAGVPGVEGSILTAILQLCRQRHVMVVAEGVETERQAALLADAGVRFGQGFALGTPQSSIPN